MLCIIMRPRIGPLVPQRVNLARFGLIAVCALAGFHAVRSTGRLGCDRPFAKAVPLRCRIARFLRAACANAGLFALFGAGRLFGYLPFAERVRGFILLCIANRADMPMLCIIMRPRIGPLVTQRVNLARFGLIAVCALTGFHAVRSAGRLGCDRPRTKAVPQRVPFGLTAGFAGLRRCTGRIRPIMNVRLRARLGRRFGPAVRLGTGGLHLYRSAKRTGPGPGPICRQHPFAPLVIANHLAGNKPRHTDSDQQHQQHPGC